MGFFAKPNLDNQQFKQLTGSTLSLSGVTHIMTPSGLTLLGSCGNIPIVTTGEQDGYVLTYSCVKKRIELQLSAGSGGTSIYNGSSPSTCSVGGLSAGSSLSGLSLSCIIQEMVAPALQPVVTAPSMTSFSIVCSPSTSTGYYEIGSTLSTTACSCFNRGCISPQYTSICDKRSGPPNTYKYSSFSGITCVASSFLSNSLVFPTHIISGNESYTGNVCYDAGYLVKNSCGGNSTVSPNPLPLGITPTFNVIVATSYPYFWGTGSTQPVAGQTLINNAVCKCVSISTGDVVVTNYNAAGQYIWVAIPATSTSKTKWQGGNSPSNCGSIPGTLFLAETCSTVNSPTGLWSTVPYKFYISSYATSINYSMTFKNS